LEVLEVSPVASRTEQIQAFRKLVVTKHPELFGPPVLHVKSDDDLDKRISSGLADARRHVGGIRSTYAALKDQLPVHLAAFQRTFPDFECDFPIYFMPSLGQFDGAGRIIGGKPALVFGVDVIAAIDTPDELKILFDHELFHRYHAKVAGMSDDLEEGEVIWRALWAEGLATYVSLALNPEKSMQDVLFVPKDLIARAKPHLREIAADLKPHLDQVNPPVFFKYFDAGRDTPDLPARTGYYVGCLIAQILARNASLSTLAHWRGTSLRTGIGLALDEIARSQDRD
jgi:hypothetical protein